MRSMQSRMLQKAVSLDPARCDANFLLGKLLCEEGRLKDAEKALLSGQEYRSASGRMRPGTEHRIWEALRGSQGQYGGRCLPKARCEPEGFIYGQALSRLSVVNRRFTTPFEPARFVASTISFLLVLAQLTVKHCVLMQVIDITYPIAPVQVLAQVDRSKTCRYIVIVK